MKPLRVAFAGSHEISWHSLKAIADLCRVHGDDLVGVFNLLPEAGAKHAAFVEFTALEAEYGFPHYRVKSLSSPETLDLLRQLELDALFIIGWHRIVPQEVIDCAPYCIGVHSSLLPRNRGSSPINWAIIRGETVGGLTLFHLTPGVDSGDLIGQKAFAIGPDDGCADAYAKATVIAVELLREHWGALRARSLARVPQDESAATFNERRRPADGWIDWNKPARELHDWVRALSDPYPGAFTTFRGKRLFLWSARPAEDAASPSPGVFLPAGETLRIGTGEGSLEVLSLQFEGEPRCAAVLFSSVYAVAEGEACETTPL